jgi:type IV pilus assembly protein PilM
MSILNQISRLVKDPSPNYVFELSEAGIAFAQPGNGRPGDPGFAPFEPGTLVVSPVEDNIHKADAAAAVLRNVAPLDHARKRRRAALILPDYAARVSVLDFDAFPSSSEEQLSLIRFRLKKTLPFDIDSAAVSYFAQPAEKGATIEVVAVFVALEIIARYEALFRGMNFHTGEVTTSALAALHLCPPATRADAVNVIAKLSAKTLTVMVLRGEILKLFRCVALEEVTEEQILAVLQPTLSYVEDELAAPAEKLTLCGFAPGALSGIGCEKGALRSTFGAPGAFNAGLLGYLEGARN